MDWDHPDRRFQSPSEEVYENYDGQRSTRDMYSPGWGLKSILMFKQSLAGGVSCVPENVPDYYGD